MRIEDDSPLHLSGAERQFERSFRRLPAEVRLLRGLVGDSRITGSAYAWSNMAYYIAQDYYEAALQDTRGDFVALDLGSALPIWAKMLRDKYGQLKSSERRCKMVSLDIENPAVLHSEAEKSFPSEFRRTPFYIMTGFMRDHIQADIFALPFGPNSVSFLTSFEAYPFYLGGKREGEHLAFGQRVVDILKPGGRAIFFPWVFGGDSQTNGRVLLQVKELWTESGMNPFIRRFTWGELVEHMGLREEMLMSVSPLFKDKFRKALPALILTKPK